MTAQLKVCGTKWVGLARGAESRAQGECWPDAGAGRKSGHWTDGLTDLFDAVEEAVQFWLLSCRTAAVLLLVITGPSSLLRNWRLS